MGPKRSQLSDHNRKHGLPLVSSYNQPLLDSHQCFSEKLGVLREHKDVAARLGTKKLFNSLIVPLRYRARSAM